MNKPEVDVLIRIAEALERSADASEKQLEAYNKQNHETLLVMADREKRDLEQIERIKERHEWDRKMHEQMMEGQKIKNDREKQWKEELDKHVANQDKNVIP